MKAIDVILPILPSEGRLVYKVWGIIPCATRSPSLWFRMSLQFNIQLFLDPPLALKSEIILVYALVESLLCSILIRYPCNYTCHVWMFSVHVVIPFQILMSLFCSLYNFSCESFDYHFSVLYLEGKTSNPLPKHGAHVKIHGPQKVTNFKCKINNATGM